MDTALAVLGSLAAAMALETAPAPDLDPTTPPDASCEEAKPSDGKRAKPACKPDPNTVDGVTVEGAKRGDTEGTIEPELELDEEAIQSLGVNTVGELLARLAPLMNGSRGRSDEPPVILINGQRVTGDMSGIPVEAILRTAPLREEEALAHGYRADQMVLNVVLKKRFQALTLTNEGLWLTDGGRASTDQLANLFKVEGESRTTLTGRYHRDSPLFETERGVVRTPASGAPSDPLVGAGGEGLTANRTLLPRTENATLQALHTRDLGGGTAATIGADLAASSSVQFRGLPSVTSPSALPVYIDAPQALKVRNDTHKVGLDLGLAGLKAGWRWTLNGDLDRTESASRIGRGLDASTLRPAPRDTADSVATSAKVDLTVNGTLVGLPAGRLRAMVKIGGDSRRFESESVRSGVRVDRVLTRDRTSAQINLDAPLLNHGRDGPLARLGKVSLNANGLYESFSDIGGLATVGGGLAWSPIKALNLSADYSREDGEQTPQQLNNPVQQTANSPAYDYATGQTVFITVISGGNPALRPDSRQLVKLSANYKPFEARDLRLSTVYTVTRIDNPIVNFPAASPELEAAFPTRFTRDAQGRLTGIDTRAVNFAHADTAELRSRMTYIWRWGGPKPGTGPKSLFVALNDRWRLRDEVVIRQGMAPLDKLAGASLGQFNGTPRHEVNLSANLGVPGYSLGAATFWRSPTRVNGGVLTGDLRFSAPPVVILYGSLDLGAQKALAKGRPWLKGTKLNLGLENVFDSYPHVRDRHGRTPQAYQRALINTGGGRAVRLSLRKQF